MASDAHPPPRAGDPCRESGLRRFSSPRIVPPSDIATPGEHPLAKLEAALSARPPSSSHENTAELWHLTQAALARAADVETYGLNDEPPHESGFEGLGRVLVRAGVRGANAGVLLRAAEDRPIVLQLPPHAIRAYGRLLAQLKIPPDAAAARLQEKDNLGHPAQLQAYEAKNCAAILATADAARDLHLPASMALSLLDAEYAVNGKPLSGLRQIARDDSPAARVMLDLVKSLRAAHVASQPPRGRPIRGLRTCVASLSTLCPSSLDPMSMDEDDLKSVCAQAVATIELKACSSSGTYADALRETSASLRSAWRAQVHSNIGRIPFCWALGFLAKALHATEASSSDTAKRLDTPLPSGQTILRTITRRGDVDSFKRYGQILKERRVSLPDAAFLLNGGNGDPPLMLSYEQGDTGMIRTFASLLRSLAFPASTALSLLDVDTRPPYEPRRRSSSFDREVQKIRLALIEPARPGSHS